MAGRFVMLPSGSGQFLVDPDRVVCGRPKVVGASSELLIDDIWIAVAAPLARVREILGTLDIIADTGQPDTSPAFNRRHLTFASVKDDGSTTLTFGTSGFSWPSDDAESLLAYLNR